MNMNYVRGPIQFFNCFNKWNKLLIIFVIQRKIIIMTVAGNNATMTQSNGNLNSTNVSTSIVFNAVGESVILVYNGSNWNVVSVNGATIS